MLPKKTSIKGKLLRVVQLINGTVLLLACAVFFVYEYVTYKQTRVRELTSIGKMIAANSSAALAFEDRDAANEILRSLQAEPGITLACLYDDEGRLFAAYPANVAADTLLPEEKVETFRLTSKILEGFQSVAHGNLRLGTLYLVYSMDALYERVQIYALLALIIVGLSTVLAYLLYTRLQRGISKPILALAETARAISDRQDFSVRAVKESDDEVGLFTDAFNQMLNRIEAQSNAITSFNAQLEQRVIDRTAELEAANKELESFSYSISHDLRTPLRSIHGYVNILYDEYGPRLDEEAIRLIRIVQKNSQRMGRLIDDLLAFSRLGRKGLLKSSISMQDLVEGIVEEYKREGKNPETTFIIHALPPAYADHSTIRQVWENLISNAVKYSSRQKESIVEIGSFEEGDEVVYYVKDNGAGFSMEYYDKLFGVFQRLHSEEEFEGTGVGLAIVHRIITKHDGRIWAESKPDEGATFYFSQPKSSQSR